jgi:hypothetical protein
VDKALNNRPKGTGFDPCLEHKRRWTWATKSFSMWDNKDLTLIIFDQMFFIGYAHASQVSLWNFQQLSTETLIFVGVCERTGFIISCVYIRSSCWEKPSCYLCGLLIVTSL